MNVDDVDLNLLRLFDAIYTRQKISLAADALGISQPAASQGLTRLRTMLGDPLFVRAPGGVRPTPRAPRRAPSAWPFRYATRFTFWIRHWRMPTVLIRRIRNGCFVSR